jgi:O-acetyl-ADP-ribose deacetylase (regulator of RNase III)
MSSPEFRPRISVERGDITKIEVDAIVNAANPIMLGGGGVDGAIHAAAGPGLLAACRRVRAVEGIRCPPGAARITPGFALPARYVIHTVGPVYRRAPDPDSTLRAAYASSLALARDHGLASIAFPAISTGAYGFPLIPAATIALSTAAEAWGSVRWVRFVLHTAACYDAFVQTQASLGLCEPATGEDQA